MTVVAGLNDSFLMEQVVVFPQYINTLAQIGIYRHSVLSVTQKEPQEQFCVGHCKVSTFVEEKTGLYM